MGWGASLTRLNPQRVLKTIALLEMLYWFLSGAITLMIFNFKDRYNLDVLNDIKAEFGSSRRVVEAEAKYRALIRAWHKSTSWIVVTAACLFLTQIFLLYGVNQKNRCVIFCWILFMIVLGATRITAIMLAVVSTSHSYLKYTNVLWLLRLFSFYLAAKYMLQITNEKLGSEEVEPPSFRPQTDDPREFREGINYPTFPRSLEFADRVAGKNKFEHAHPKRWVPTYDAFDEDGRMVVVVDDPVYEPL